MDKDEDSPWQYKPDGGSAAEVEIADERDAQPQPEKDSKNVSWEAPEFIEHHHGAGWYAGLVAGTVILAAIAFLQDKIAAVIIIVLGIIVGLYARQKPAQAKYEVSGGGLSVNNKVYKYSDYKSFAIFRDSQLSSVSLYPLKRFLPPISAYFEPGDEKKITDALGEHLPFENRKLDNIDRLFRLLRL